jgi:glutathione peroxidase
MNKYILTMSIASMLFSFFSCSAKTKPEQAQSKVSFHELSTSTLFGEEVNFESFKGKKVLIVNTASKCGYTPQYAELEELHKQYKDNLVIIGFPANNFMKQEPGTNEDIAAFCEVNYGVTFLMSEKISVKGDDIHPVYQWLTDKEKNGWNTQEPKWNFHKYLIDENGELIAVFASKVKPLDEDITSLLK